MLVVGWTNIASGWARWLSGESVVREISRTDRLFLQFVVMWILHEVANGIVLDWLTDIVEMIDILVIL